MLFTPATVITLFRLEGNAWKDRERACFLRVEKENRKQHINLKHEKKMQRRGHKTGRGDPYLFRERKIDSLIFLS